MLKEPYFGVPPAMQNTAAPLRADQRTDKITLPPLPPPKEGEATGRGLFLGFGTVLVGGGVLGIGLALWLLAGGGTMHQGAVKYVLANDGAAGSVMRNPLLPSEAPSMSPTSPEVIASVEKGSDPAPELAPISLVSQTTSTDTQDEVLQGSLTLTAQSEANAEGGLVAGSEVEQLLQLAAQSLDSLKLTTPEQDSALYYYTQVLALEPDNETAQAGMHEIARRYAWLAEREMNRGDYQKARQFVETGLSIEPDNGVLLEQSLLLE